MLGANKVHYGRCQVANESFALSAHGRRICLLELAIVLKLKNNEKNSSGEMQQL